MDEKKHKVRILVQGPPGPLWDDLRQRIDRLGFVWAPDLPDPRDSHPNRAPDLVLVLPSGPESQAADGMTEANLPLGVPVLGIAPGFEGGRGLRDGIPPPRTDREFEIMVRAALQSGRAVSGIREAFDAALDSLEGEVLATDLEKRVVRVEVSQKRMSPGRPENRPGRFLKDVWPDPSRESMARAMDEVLSGSPSVKVPYSADIAQNSRHFVATISPRMVQGCLQGLMVTSRDMTELTETVRSFEEYRRFFRRAADASPLLLFVIDSGSKRMVYLNEKVRPLLGYQPDYIKELDLAQIRELVHPDDRGIMSGLLDQEGHWAENDLMEAEARIRHDQGDWRLMRIRAMKFFRNGNQDEAQVLGTMEDITETRKVEIHLRESNATLRALLENTPMAVIMLDPEGKVLLWSGAAELIFGWAEDEVLGRTLPIVAPEHYQEFFAGHQRVIAGEVTVQKEVRQLRKDGFLIDVSLNLAPIRGTDGQVASVVGLLEDITQRKKAESEAAWQKEQLMEAAKMASLGTLVAGVAHEINNPNSLIMANSPLIMRLCNGIMGTVEKYVPERDKVRFGNLSWPEIEDMIPKLLSGIIDGASRIDRIVKNLKDFARNSPIDMNESVALNQVVRSAMTLLDNMIRESTSICSLDLGAELPAIKGNAQRLEQVVINLAVNACQAVSDRQGRIALATLYDEETEDVVFRVQDNGRGIPSECLARVFDPFFTTKRDTKGTGLGLSITTTIVQEHGGLMDIESKENHGTKVTVRLPARRCRFLSREMEG